MSGGRSSLKSVAVVSGFSLAQLVAQFAFQVLLAKYFGAKQEMDAYVAALVVPTVVSSIFATSLGYAFLPIFIDTRERLGADKAWSLASNLGMWLLVLLGGITILATVFAGPLMVGLNRGFPPAEIELTTQLFRVLAWLMVTNGMISFLQSLYHCENRFGLPAVAPVIGTCLTVAITLGFHETKGIYAVAWAVLAGNLTSVVIQSPILLGNLRLGWRLDEGVRRVVRLLSPLLLGAVIKFDPLVNQYLISQMPEGSVSHWGYTGRILTALLTLCTSGLSIVAFPALARHSAAGNHVELRSEISHALRFLCFLLTPVAAGLIGFGGYVVRDLFERGEFTISDTQIVSTLVVLHLGVIVGAAFGEIMAKVFYAMHDTRTPVVISVVLFTLIVPLKFLLAEPTGLVGLAVLTSCFFVIVSTAQMVCIGRRLGAGCFAETVTALVRYTFGSGVALVVAYCAIQLPVAAPSGPAAVLAALAYMLVMLWTGDEFAVTLWNYLKSWAPPRAFGR